MGRVVPIKTDKYSKGVSIRTPHMGRVIKNAQIKIKKNAKVRIFS